MKKRPIPWDCPEGDELESRLKAPADSKARSRARKTFRRNRLVGPLDATSEPAAEASAEIALALEEALALLSPRERQVLELEAAGFKDVQIAAQLGVHRNTVGNDKNRAYAKLRRALRYGDKT
jgi:RNA polymerase sigma factor (sigma-70 family)